MRRQWPRSTTPCSRACSEVRTKPAEQSSCASTMCARPSRPERLPQDAPAAQRTRRGRRFCARGVAGGGAAVAAVGGVAKRWVNTEERIVGSPLRCHRGDRPPGPRGRRAGGGGAGRAQRPLDRLLRETDEELSSCSCVTRSASSADGDWSVGVAPSSALRRRGAAEAGASSRAAAWRRGARRRTATSHEGSLDGMQRELERGRGGGQVGVAVGNGERRTQRRERLRAQKVDIERHGGELVGSQPRSARPPTRPTRSRRPPRRRHPACPRRSGSDWGPRQPRAAAADGRDPTAQAAEACR